jgi:hypothetical protein
MFMTIISAAAVALPRFCSVFALMSCASTTLDIPPGHPAHPATDAAPSSAEVSIAHGSLASVEPVSAQPLTAEAHPHDHHAHEHATADSDAKDKKADARSSWTCPMHPEVLRDGPGSCPVCGMHLVQRKASPPPGDKQ